MSRRIKVVSIVGKRPNFVKIANEPDLVLVPGDVASTLAMPTAAEMGMPAPVDGPLLQDPLQAARGGTKR
jgi:UDP-N-acetylglucosamine 2-epimerase